MFSSQASLAEWQKTQRVAPSWILPVCRTEFACSGSRKDKVLGSLQNWNAVQKQRHYQGLCSKKEPTEKVQILEAPLGFEPRISCLQDKRFDQLSHGAQPRWTRPAFCLLRAEPHNTRWCLITTKGAAGIGPSISCLLDRRFNQLCHCNNLRMLPLGGRLRGSKHPEKRPRARHCTA